MNKPINVRKGNELDVEALAIYLRDATGKSTIAPKIMQYPGGFSNLTYLIHYNGIDIVLRKAPIGAQVKSAHDMSREFKVLSLLKPLYDKVPKPISFCENVGVIGTPFYLMEKVSGLILRNTMPKKYDIKPKDFNKLSHNVIDNFVDLHELEIYASGLIDLGNPKGYVERQVKGWISRYKKSMTEEIGMMDSAAEWLGSSIPQSDLVSFLHNDYKYDNIVLNNKNFEIQAVLDWEMSTVGDPFMDLGTMLAYWVEADEHPALKQFNLTWADGNLNREELVQYYADKRGVGIDDVVFYYVFGCFKLGVIAQQIYARYKKGMTNDPRFGGLIHVVKACGLNAFNAIKYNRISNFR